MMWLCDSWTSLDICDSWTPVDLSTSKTKELCVPLRPRISFLPRLALSMHPSWRQAREPGDTHTFRRHIGRGTQGHPPRFRSVKTTRFGIRWDFFFTANFVISSKDAPKLHHSGHNWHNARICRDRRHWWLVTAPDVTCEIWCCQVLRHHHLIIRWWENLPSFVSTESRCIPNIWWRTVHSLWVFDDFDESQGVCQKCTSQLVTWSFDVWWSRCI